MNTLKLVTFICISAGLSSCGINKTEYVPPDIKVDQKYQDLLQSLKAGGQPGEITINGAAVNIDGTLDQRISVEQTAGESTEKTKISEKNLPKFNSDLKRKDDYKPTKFEKYLNVGCDLKDDSRIAGMVELKNKPNEFGLTDTFGAAASMVDKIFICGKVEVNETVTILNANEVILDNAELSMWKPLGSITIITDVLSVEGKNLVSTKGISDSTASLLPAPSIFLNVFEKLVGAGSLKIQSAGGNYVEKK